MKENLNQLPRRNTENSRDFHFAGLLRMRSTTPKFHNTQTATWIHTGEETGLPELKAKHIRCQLVHSVAACVCLAQQPAHACPNVLGWVSGCRPGAVSEAGALPPGEEGASVQVNKLSGRRQTTYLSTTLGWGPTNWTPWKYLSSRTCERPLGEGK